METELNNKKIGGNIDAWCGKCKMMLAHTIEAMVGDKPARVHCNTCRSQHSYKAQAPGTGGRAEPKPRASRLQTLLKTKDTAVAKVYSPKQTYSAGDVLEHPTFGRGVLIAVKDGSKIEVQFESGPKTLIQGR